MPENIPDLIYEAMPKLWEAFDGLWTIRLRRGPHPEYWRVTVEVPGRYADKAEACLKAFDDSWWLENCHRAGPDHLTFDYEVRHGPQ